MFGGDTYHASVAEPSIQQVVDTSIIDGDNMKTNMQWASNPGSLYALASIAIAYFAWNYLQNKEGIRAGIKPENIQANLHSLIIITLGAVIGINAMNVFFTKLAHLNIPFVSRFAGFMLPLFHL